MICGAYRDPAGKLHAVELAVDADGRLLVSSSASGAVQTDLQVLGGAVTPANPVPVMLQGAVAEIEFKNDSGNPIPVQSTALGAPADAPFAGTGPSSIVAALKGIFAKLSSALNIRPLTAVTDSVTATVTFPATQAISAAALPLPAGSSTSALQTAGNTSLASLDTKIPTVGQKTGALSSPVVLASDQLPIQLKAAGVTISGSITTASTAQNAIAANASRSYLFIQNSGAGGQLIVNFSGAASAAAGIVIQPYGFWESPAHYAPTGAVSVFSTLAGQKFTVVEA